MQETRSSGLVALIKRRLSVLRAFCKQPFRIHLNDFLSIMAEEGLLVLKYLE